MSSNTEVQTLAQTFEDVRALTKMYIGRAEGIDPHQAPEMDGIRLNPMYWLVAHLAWSENYLLVRGLSGESMDIPWLSRFEFGASSEPQPDDPSWEEVQQGLDQVHARTMELLGRMSDDDLAADNLADIEFRAGKAKRVIVRHAIRHEPMHAGQIGWLTKLLKVPARA